ncbi:MAG: SDR family oxidoreductase [Pseudomonadales bacterium]|nr:SDR family oxidoreductase [Pseudomonadales bacterium]
MTQINHLKDKVIIVTGAASGFGKLVSQKAAASGARIVAADISEEALLSMISDLQASGHQAAGMKADVTRRTDMQAVAQQAISTFGQIDILINNAGIMPLAFFADHADAAEAWDRCIDINIKGVVNGIAAVYDQMISQGRGHILNLSSIYGNYGVPGGAVYGATKAAVDFISESLRQESLGKIKVTTIKPTGIPGTGLGAGVINPLAISGILRDKAPEYMGKFELAATGQLPAAQTDPNSVEYWALAPEYLADQIIYAINQPWGVSIAELTVRATGDAYMM